MKRLKVLSAAACALLLGLPVYGQDYHSNDLTPAGASAGKLTGASGGKEVGGAMSGPYGYSHAVLLSGNALSGIDLHPGASYYYSMATCMDDVQQGGYGYSVSGIHALVWNGSAASYADLNPSGYSFSYCLGVNSGEQVGYAQNQTYFITGAHAFCWHGSAASAIDLHPIGSAFPYSHAVGCRNAEEVGFLSTIAYGEGDSVAYHTGSHAARWAGSAATYVDLHPLGYDSSEALCTSGTQQGGWGYIAAAPNRLHALLWTGTADSAVDLNPAGFNDTKITAITDTKQVGEGWVGAPGVQGSVRHALVWSGTADTVVDLNQYLPAGYTNAVATGIDPNGNVVGYAYNILNSGALMPSDALAVVFAPGAAPASGLSSLSLSPSNVAPGDLVQGQVTLSAPAPAGGMQITFLSTSPTNVATPAGLTIAEGDTNATFTLPTGGSTLTVPTALKLYATDGSVSRATPLTLTPVVKLASVTANPVEGGFSTWGTVSLNIPAQSGGAVVNLTSANSGLATVTPSITIPFGYSSMNFAINTAPVATTTVIPISAALNDQTASGSVTLSPAPVISISALSFPSVVGGTPVTGTITLNNFPRDAAGATISLSSGDTQTLQVPASVTVPQGAFSVSFTATTAPLSGLKGVSVKATYNGGSLTTTVLVYPPPTVTITQADYVQDLQLLKVAATTTFTNAVLTFGTDPTAGPIGTMQIEAGVYKGSTLMATAPSVVTVWNSAGGLATVPVNIKTSSATTTGGGGGGGGGGGTTTSATYKISIATVGKGTVTLSPTGTSFAAGTVVTLTAKPDPGSPWIGWTGDASGTANPIQITMTKDMKVSALFK